MTTLKIVGVPEHFNLPWQLCLENGDFEKQGIDLQWTDIPEGTGKMCQLLRDGQTDLAVILTEGIVKDIAAGNPSKIVQVYVDSPLIWGIHVAASSPFQTLAELNNAKAAISRLGSGSQLMAYVNASNQGWETDSLQFEIVNTIDGAVTALTNGTADYFMWERFMTQPLVDQGIFRRLADCPTPWPCFVIAARNEVLEQHPKLIHNLLQTINRETAKFKQISGIEEILVQRFGQKKHDLLEWLSLTEWSDQPLTEEMLNKVQNQLLQLGLIDKKSTFAQMVGRV
ncbi:MAG TPA: substrate-binding domain-containing protein [Flavobacterium sp.]|nr:substrate-binding domain-containing protein [Flavobacterium sp.]